MIHIESLSIRSFRGIKRLDLSFGRKSFGICGDNGTGKSGVVDAIEFALTGNITRLTGEGFQGISVKVHGPHVDSREEPQNSIVALTGFLPSLNKTVTIERSMRRPQEPTITPTDEDVLKVVVKLAEHPEFALSRRDILKYVLARPGDRSKEVQDLLRIDDVGTVRIGFQKLENSCKSEVGKAEAEVEAATSRLIAALQIPELKGELLLKAVNERRAILGLEPLYALEKDTSLKSGVAAPVGGAKKPDFSKKSAMTDMETLIALVDGVDAVELSNSMAKVISTLQRFERNPTLLLNLKRQAFLKTGLGFVVDDVCPLCDKEWDMGALKAHLQKKVDEASNAVKAKEEMSPDVLRIQKAITHLSSLIGGAERYGRALSVPEGILPEWKGKLQVLSAQLTGLDDVSTIRPSLENGWRQLPSEGKGVLASVMEKVKTMPEASKEDEAKEFLILCQERLDVYREQRRRHSVAKEQYAVALKVSKAYTKSAEDVLKGLYQEVEGDFSRYYRLINHDEAAFKGELIPSVGKLGFDVDFYGRGMFPPGAYHSEGHQDGMGLCLYLALMKKIMGEQFNFAVLDDVLMSVDVGHRKAVCRLLSTEFPVTQFIFTTHDTVWLKHMISEGIVSNKTVVHFRNWTVDDGPTVWDSKDLWTEIAEDLDKGDVPGAAHKLRRSLEFIFHELAGELRAKVEYRAGAIYDLGELLPPVCGAWQNLLEKAIKAAESWGKDDKVAVLKGVLDDLKDKLAKSQVEQWLINKAVHYTEWANFQKGDFQSVVAAFRGLVDCFRCAGCQSWVRVNPPSGEREMLNCDCDTFGYTLKGRPT